MRLRIATGNAGKLREFSALLAPYHCDVLGIDDLEGLNIVEDGDTFAANAAIKAQTVFARTGDPTLADDSGIVVDALDGAPGIYSARYAGDDGPNADAANRLKLLHALRDVPTEKRSARFVCVLAYCTSAADIRYFEAAWEGHITFDERGRGGFGYDPIFQPRGDTRTSAELPADEKNRISHRGQATAAFLDFFRSTIGTPK